VSAAASSQSWQLHMVSQLVLIRRQGNYTVTLIEGDGIGPEISDTVKDIYKAAGVSFA